MVFSPQFSEVQLKQSISTINVYVLPRSKVVDGGVRVAGVVRRSYESVMEGERAYGETSKSRRRQHPISRQQ